MRAAAVPCPHILNRAGSPHAPPSPPAGGPQLRRGGDMDMPRESEPGGGGADRSLALPSRDASEAGNASEAGGNGRFVADSELAMLPTAFGDSEMAPIAGSRVRKHKAKKHGNPTLVRTWLKIDTVGNATVIQVRRRGGARLVGGMRRLVSVPAGRLVSVAA